MAGPRNFQGRLGKGLKARGPRARNSKASMPRSSAARAKVPGTRPPAGGGRPVKAQSSMASVSGQKKVNGDRNTVSRGKRLGKSRADGASRI